MVRLFESPLDKANCSSSVKLRETPEALSEITFVSLLPSIPISSVPRLPVESSRRETFFFPPEFSPVISVPLSLTSSPESLTFISPSLFFAIDPDSNVNFPSVIDKKNKGLEESLSNSFTENSDLSFNVKSELSIKEIIIEDPASVIILSFMKI